MSKLTFLLLPVVVLSLFLSNSSTVLGQTIVPNQKTQDAKPVKYSGHSKPIASQELAALDCNSVPDVPGMRGLCGVLNNGLQSIADSIAGLATGMVQSFLDNLINFVWKMPATTGPLAGQGGGLIDSLFIRGYARLFKNIDPVTGAVITDAYHNAPIPMVLISRVYQNSPNLQTANTLAYMFGNNLLGTKTAYGAACPGPDCSGRARLSLFFIIWEKIRNISYLLIILVLVIYGLMVMFRYKIDPRTIATAQAAIPKLAIALVLITFSYTIASLAIDASQLLLNTVFNFYQDINNSVTAATGNACPVAGPCYPFIKDPLNLQSGIQSTFDLYKPIFNDPIKDTIAGFLIQFAVWYIMFQLFFALIKAYATLLIAAVLGPVAIAFGIMPGGKTNAMSAWIKTLASNALVFPAMYFLINMAVYVNQITDPIPLPNPLTTTAGGGNSISGLVIAGILVICTKVPAYIDEFLGNAPSSASRSGTDIGQAARKAPLIGGMVG